MVWKIACCAALLLCAGFVPVDAPGKPENIILVIGDGMGIAHIALAEYLHKPPSPLAQMEVIGLQKTYSANNLKTDS